MSSSLSELSPIPSLSKSEVSFGSNGNKSSKSLIESRSVSGSNGLVPRRISSTSLNPSLSSSRSQKSPNPSLSVSFWSGFSTLIQLSLQLKIPSPSLSASPSSASRIPSLSLSRSTSSGILSLSKSGRTVMLITHEVSFSPHAKDGVDAIDLNW